MPILSWRVSHSALSLPPPFFLLWEERLRHLKRCTSVQRSFGLALLALLSSCLPGLFPTLDIFHLPLFERLMFTGEGMRIQCSTCDQSVGPVEQSGSILPSPSGSGHRSNRFRCASLLVRRGGRRRDDEAAFQTVPNFWVTGERARSRDAPSVPPITGALQPDSSWPPCERRVESPEVLLSNRALVITVVRFVDLFHRVFRFAAVLDRRKSEYGSQLAPMLQHFAQNSPGACSDPMNDVCGLPSWPTFCAQHRCWSRSLISLRTPSIVLPVVQSS